MKAATHNEVYRPFRGELRAGGPRFWPIVTSATSTAVKKKLPLLLLYVIPAIATIVFSFLVYLKFQAEDVTSSRDGLIGGVAGMLARQATQILQVKNQVIENAIQMRVFAVLATAWFGAGAFAEDRRVGAHQLYFARPLTRLDYFLGKFLAVSLWGALAFLAPGIVINLVAIFTSPEWSFLKEEWDVPLRTIAFGCVWVTLVSSVVLAVSSLTQRKMFALVGVFGFFGLGHAFGGALSFFEGRHELRLLSPYSAMRRVGNQIFGVSEDWIDYHPALPGLVVGGTIVVALLIVAVRLRRLEVVS